MRYLILFTIYITSTLGFSSGNAIWQGKSNPNCTHFVEIPLGFDFQFPTQEDYLFGYFIIDSASTNYINVGLDTIYYGVQEKHVISISHDEDKIAGYQKGEQLISLCIPVKLAGTHLNHNYGIELQYENEQKFYSDNKDTSVVIGMKSNTWDTHPLLKDTYYVNQQCQIYTPYGINAKIGATSVGLDVDTSHIYINTQTTPAGEYSFHMQVDSISPIIYYNEEYLASSGFQFKLLESLTPLLSSQIVLCNDQTSIHILTEEPNPENPSETLFRTPINNAPLIITSAGIYEYELSNDIQTIIETVVVYESDFKTLKPTLITTNQSCNQEGSVELISPKNTMHQLDSIFFNKKFITPSSYIHTENSLLFEGLTTGMYTLKLIDEFGCSYEDSTFINNDISILTPEIFTTAQSCTQGGSIEIVASENTLLDSIFFNQQVIDIQSPLLFEELPSGIYDIKLIDQFGCTYKENIFVENDNSDCANDLLFNPNDPESYIFFEQEGPITIINLSHQEVSHLIGPMKWNGIDDNGGELPVGVYFVLFDDGQVKTITLVK